MIGGYSKNIPVSSLWSSPEITPASPTPTPPCNLGGGAMCLIHLFVYLLLSHQGAKTVNPTLQGKEKQVIHCLSLVADEGQRC